jgi:hypothetical protein
MSGSRANHFILLILFLVLTEINGDAIDDQGEILVLSNYSRSSITGHAGDSGPKMAGYRGSFYRNSVRRGAEKGWRLIEGRLYNKIGYKVIFMVAQNR